MINATDASLQIRQLAEQAPGGSQDAGFRGENFSHCVLTSLDFPETAQKLSITKANKKITRKRIRKQCEVRAGEAVAQKDLNPNSLLLDLQPETL